MNKIPFARFNWIALSFRGCTLDTPGFDEFIIKSLQMGVKPSIFPTALGLLVVTHKRPNAA